jgi:hypothetical protein
MEKTMKPHGHLVVTDLTTNEPADFNLMGAETRQFRLTFANAAAFESEKDHWQALHHDASTHAQLLHHNHNEFVPENLQEARHNGQPAYIMTVRRAP